MTYGGTAAGSWISWMTGPIIDTPPSIYISLCMNVDYVHINDWPWGRAWNFVVDGGIALGRASLLKDAPYELFISDFVVAQENRREGYGRYLAERIEYMAKVSLPNIHLLRLWVDVTKPEGCAFWEACGFKNEGFLDESADFFVYTKEIRP